MSKTKLKKTYTLLTIDPGLAHTGWAYGPSGNPVPTDHGVSHFICPPERQRIACVSSVESLLNLFVPDRVVIEGVSFWSSSPRSAAMHGQGGAQQLSYAIGEVIAICRAGKIEIEDVDVRTWKGQLTPHALAAAIKRSIGIQYSPHEREAVGIRLWKLDML